MGDTPPEAYAEQRVGDSGRQPLLVIVGVALLGVAVALLMFGGELLASRPAEAPVLAEAPAFGTPVAGDRIAGAPLGALEVGEAAPDFTLTDLEGEAVSLSDFDGRPVIVNFWATWCAPCRLEMPDLEKVYQARKEDGLVILAVNRAEEPELVRQFFVEEFDLGFTALLDREDVVAYRYGVGQFMPTSFFVNGEGQIAVVHRGLMTEEQVEGYLAEMEGNRS